MYDPKDGVHINGFVSTVHQVRLKPRQRRERISSGLRDSILSQLRQVLHSRHHEGAERAYASSSRLRMPALRDHEAGMRARKAGMRTRHDARNTPVLSTE